MTPAPAWTLVGLTLGWAFVHAAWQRDEAGRRRMLALGLVVAAAVYVLFAVRARDLTAALRAGAGLAVFAAPSLLDMRRRAIWLGAGWAAHIGWDLAIHSATPAVAPAWYAYLCLGFDAVAAVGAMYHQSGVRGQRRRSQTSIPRIRPGAAKNTKTNCQNHIQFPLGGRNEFPHPRA